MDALCQDKCSTCSLNLERGELSERGVHTAILEFLRACRDNPVICYSFIDFLKYLKTSLSIFLLIIQYLTLELRDKGGMYTGQINSSKYSNTIISLVFVNYNVTGIKKRYLVKKLTVKICIFCQVFF